MVAIEQTMLISERWIDTDGHYIRIGDENCQLVDVRRVGDQIALVLRDGAGERAVQLINLREVEPMQSIPAGTAIAPADWATVVGAFPDRTHVSDSKMDRLLGSLNNKITLSGETQAPGSVLVISGRRQNKGQVELHVRNEESECAVSFVWFGAIGESNYCMLMLPPEERTGDLGLGGDNLIFRMRDKNSLVVLSDDELSRLAPQIARAFLSRGNVFASDVDPVLGFVPSA